MAVQPASPCAEEQRDEDHVGPGKRAKPSVRPRPAPAVALGARRRRGEVVERLGDGQPATAARRCSIRAADFEGQAHEVRRQLHRQHLCRSACVLRPPSSAPDAVDRELPRKLALRRMPAFDRRARRLLIQGRPDHAQRAERVCSAPHSSDQPLKVAMRRRRRGEVTAARLPPLHSDSVVPVQRTRAHRSQMRDISSRQAAQQPNRADQQACSAGD